MIPASQGDQVGGRVPGDGRTHHRHVSDVEVA